MKRLTQSLGIESQQSTIQDLGNADDRSEVISEAVRDLS